MSYSHRTGKQTGRITEALNLALLCIISAISAAGWSELLLPERPVVPDAMGASVLGEVEFSVCSMDTDGYLRGEVFGAIQRELDWHGQQMLCDGMPRPGNGGFRLMFSEYSQEPEQGLRLIVGIVGAKLGTSNEEWIANVTVIDQDRNLFFSTQGLERCWVKLTEQIRLSNPANDWRINGQLYCVGALASVDGTDSVTFGDIEFSGRLSVEPEEQHDS